MESLNLDFAGRLARLTLSRPGRHNALTSGMLAGLVEAAEAIAAQGSDVVVLGGDGVDFSVGFDLEEIASGDTRAAVLGGEAVEAIRGLEAITVARLSGWVVGGGVVLAGACDLRVGDVTTRFRIPEVTMGIPLGWGAVPLLVSELGPSLTRDLVMTGRDMDADEAARHGFLHRVGSDRDVETDALVERLLGMPPAALRSTKRQVAAAASVTIDVEAEARLLLSAAESAGFEGDFDAYRDRIREAEDG
jgi:enoyl-CoA hydratase/carnithine racemase